VTDKIESVHNLSTIPDNNNIATFSYGNSSLIKNEMSFKHDMNFIKSEIPYSGNRSTSFEPSTLHLNSSSKCINFDHSVYSMQTSNLFQNYFRVYFLFHLSDENNSTIQNQSYMDYYIAEDEESLISHSPKNEQDIKPFNQDNKSLLLFTLDSMTNIAQVKYT